MDSQMWLPLATNFLDLQVWKVAYMEEIFGMTYIFHASLRVGAWIGNKKGYVHFMVYSPPS